MTIEYILLMTVAFALVIKSFISAPRQAFMESGPRLASRVESQITTGRGFQKNHGVSWIPDRQ